MADALFPERSALGEDVTLSNEKFRVMGIIAKQGTFLGLFSFDNQIVIPLAAFKKYFAKKGSDTDVRVKVANKEHLDEAKAELAGDMRRVRGLLPDQDDDFAISAQESFKATLDPIKTGIAMGGLFITGLALFVGAIGIMNITFVSVRERTREIGTRKALGRAPPHDPAAISDRSRVDLSAGRSCGAGVLVAAFSGRRRGVSVLSHRVFHEPRAGGIAHFGR